MEFEINTELQDLIKPKLINFINYVREIIAPARLVEFEYNVK